jgi:hypothetical protein
MGRRLYPLPWGYRFGWALVLLGCAALAVALSLGLRAAGLTVAQVVLFVVVAGGALAWSVWVWRGPR